MHSIVKNFVKTLKLPQRFATSSSSAAGYVTGVNMAGTLASESTIFQGKNDRFNGVTVDSVSEPRKNGTFAKCLVASLEQWKSEGKRAIWFRVGLEQSDWVPVLAKNGFKFHHAKDEQVTLYRWLPVDESCNIPPYAHTMLGVGALVYNEESGEILVVKERYSVVTPMWKFPGGYVEPGEDIALAAQREVKEETGIEAEFKHVISFRHAHGFAFGCSDIYMIACLTPRSFEIDKCNREIAHCKWMKLEDYVLHPEVHENNRLVAEKFIEYRSHKTAVTVQSMTHPALKKSFAVFTVSKTED